MNTILQKLQTVHRARIPQAFGQAGLVIPYDSSASAVQYLLDSINDFKAEPRLTALTHLYSIRKFSNVPLDHNRAHSHHHMPHYRSHASSSASGMLYHESLLRELRMNQEGSWGIRKDIGYLIVCPDRVVLMHITSCYDVETTSGNHPNPSVANTAKRPRIDRKLL